MAESFYEGAAQRMLRDEPYPGHNVEMALLLAREDLEFLYKLIRPFTQLLAPADAAWIEDLFAKWDDAGWWRHLTVQTLLHELAPRAIGEVELRRALT